MTAQDDLIRKFSVELEKVYVFRTRGDYTWTGILSTFAREWETLRLSRGNTSVAIESETTPGKLYTVEFDGEDYSCDCPDFRYNNKGDGYYCKHIGRALREA